MIWHFLLIKIKIRIRIYISIENLKTSGHGPHLTTQFVQVIFLTFLFISPFLSFFLSLFVSLYLSLFFLLWGWGIPSPPPNKSHTSCRKYSHFKLKRKTLFPIQTRHPVQLLNEVRGGVVFNVIGESGAPPNTIFTMGIELDGRLFKGEGRNKKEAKRNCAIVALQELYDIVYPKNEGMDESS